MTYQCLSADLIGQLLGIVNADSLNRKLVAKSRDCLGTKTTKINEIDKPAGWICVQSVVQNHTYNNTQHLHFQFRILEHRWHPLSFILFQQFTPVIECEDAAVFQRHCKLSTNSTPGTARDWLTRG